MAVAPFLPRTGVPYIPRPALEVGVQIAGAGEVDVTVSGITTDRGDGIATLRVFNAAGQRVHDLQEPFDTADDEVVFSGVAVQAQPHRVVALTDHGQRGSAIVNQASGFAPPTLTSINPTTVEEGATETITLTGTGFRESDTVLLDGVTVTSVFVNATTQTLSFTGNELAGAYPVVVRNAEGVLSDPQTLTVTAP